MKLFEIERKFLLTKENFEKLIETSKQEYSIKQYYTKISDLDEERVRLEYDKYCFVCSKTGSGLTRTEDEHEVNFDYYANNINNKIGNEIVKTRYVVNINDVDIEVDRYYGYLDGLYIAEVEFQSVNEANNYIPNLLFGDEVTNNKNYKNKNLALKK